ncbi:MAG: S1/P1 nuclease [Rikenellaceae bacterium]
MRLLITILYLVALLPQSAWAWSKKGHDVICYIAENHLTDKALSKVTEILEGKSMVYYSSWMDTASHTKEYEHTAQWHYFNIDKSVAQTERVEGGDALSAVAALVAQLGSGTLEGKEQSDALKMLIHIVGDMHQPMHMGRKEDYGGNTIPVVYFTESTNLHTLWDYHIVEGARSWSYSEWQDQIDRASKREIKEITSGSYADWAAQTFEVAKEVYKDTPAETRVYYDYVAKYGPIVEQQFLYAGLRLAHILNEIYN